MTSIPPVKGVYIILGYLTRDKVINVGCLGRKLFRRGLYLYVGSARGPGGLKARVGRHLVKDKRVKWHIDYLTVDPDFKVLAILYTSSPSISERDVVKVLIKGGFSTPIKGFGSSDDRNVTSHLLYTPSNKLEDVVNKVALTLKILNSSFSIILIKC